MRYNKGVPDPPRACDGLGCDEQFSLRHALTCPKGGLPTRRDIDVWYRCVCVSLVERMCVCLFGWNRRGATAQCLWVWCVCVWMRRVRCSVHGLVRVGCLVGPPGGTGRQTCCRACGGGKSSSTGGVPARESVSARPCELRKPDAGGDASEHCVCVFLCGMTGSAYVNTLPLRVCVCRKEFEFLFCFSNGGYFVPVLCVGDCGLPRHQMGARMH